MGLHIDTLKDLQKLLKQVNLKVNNLEELQGFLAKINADEDPKKAHERQAFRHIASVGTIACIVAGICSFYAIIIPTAMTQHGGGDPLPLTLGILGILWLGAGIVTFISARMTLLALLRNQENRPLAGSEAAYSPHATAGPNGISARASTDITNDITRIAASRNLP